MKILLTGGAGFIGSHLAETLINEGHDVVCIDNLLTGSRKNIEHLELNEKFSFIECDLLNVDKVNEKLSEYDNFDLILHFASPASPIDYKKYPLETILVNSSATKYLLDLAKTHNASFLFASTSEIYGNPLEHPQKESYYGNVNTVGERSCYDESKRMGETLIHNYKNLYGLDTKIIRIFNTYGPRMRINDGRAMPTFIVNALKGNPLPVFGDGNQTRSFCYVDDLVSGILAFINSKDFAGPLNLGNDSEITILELAKKIIDRTNSSSKIEYLEMEKDDPVKRNPDINLAYEKLNYKPKVSLADGLVKTIEWFRDNC